METGACGVKSEAENPINEAIAGLRLRDIVLYESRLFRGDVMPEQDEVEALQQHKRGVRFSVEEQDRAGSSTRELHVMISLGERVVDCVTDQDPKVYFGIEADYFVVYDMICPISQDALTAFADFNAVHNVWPFWRQHVFDLIGKARLPTLQVPLFTGDGQ
jgi:preprotein translocase subunit SecB